MANIHEQSPQPIPDSARTYIAVPESDRFQRIIKPVPQLSPILEELDEMFSMEGFGDIVCAAAHQFDKDYLGWQTVRGPRAINVIGTSTLATGFEKFYAGLIENPGELIAEEAAMGQAVLDRDTRNNPFAGRRRQLLDRFMYDNRIPSLKVIEPLNGVFVDLLSSARMVAATSQDEDAKARNYRFREENKAIVANLPPITFSREDHKLMQGYTLPNPEKPRNITAVTISDIPKADADGFHMIKTIGIIGHPVIRRILTNAVIMIRAKTDSYYAPKGTPKRIRLDKYARVDALLQLYKYAPRVIEQYLDS